MAKKDKDLKETLRATGLRKKVASALADSADNARGKTPKAVTESVERLRKAASKLERRAGSSKRSEAAKKSAATRKRNAAKRSAAAKKAAKTRAKSH
jgi:hypothetical protein